jgi:N-acetylglucosaminyldiphosphoundecaprenol N-acetyl-beta-D-mannosaminyltransferase
MAGPGGRPSLTVLGVRVDNLTRGQALDRLARLAGGGRAAQVSFVNAACLNLAWDDADYRRALAGSELTLADGMGLRLAGLLLGCRVADNLNGTDLVPELLARLAGGVFLLGGAPGVAEGAAARLQRRLGVEVAGWRHGHPEPGREADAAAQVRASGAAVLLAGLGAPRQEKWLARWLPATGARLGLGVGGLLDFLSGRLPRAPRALRSAGLEWAWRTALEPRRLWKRYLLGNWVFLARVARERWSAPCGWRG